MAPTLLPRGRWLALCVILVLALQVHRALAQHATIRVLVLDDEQSEFARRLRGQTADLPIELSFLPGAGVSEATARLRQRGVDVAIWLEKPLPARPSEVCLAEGAGAALRRRPLEAPGEDDDDSSARYEIAALLVRAEVQALANSRESAGSAASTPLEMPATGPASSTERPSVAQPAELPARQTPRAFALELSLGVRGSRVGGDRSLFGLEGTLGLTRGPLVASLFYAGSFWDERTEQGVRIGLRQDRLAGHLGYGRRLWGNLHLRGGVDVGAVLIDRRAESVQANREATENRRTTSFVGAPRLALNWFLREFLCLGASVGVDLVSSPTRYILSTPSGTRELELTLWAQPWVTLGALLVLH
jgi:hypothetical protein